MTNWAAVGAIAAVLGLLQLPIVLGVGAIWRWARGIDRRLDVIEARSHERRKDDPPPYDG